MEKMEKVVAWSMCFMAAVVGFASIASGDTIEVAYVAVEAGGNESVALNGSGSSGANGLMAVDTRNPVGPLASLIDADTWAYCYELNAYTDFPFNTYTVTELDSAIGADKAALISQLWAQHYDPAWQSDTYIYSGGSHGGWTSGQPANTSENQQALAMVLAIYEINYDFNTSLTSLDLDGGSFTANAAGTNPTDAVSVAAGWLGSLVLPGDYTGASAELLSLSNGSLQDIIVEVPEPATLGLLAIGTVLLGRRKRS